jgi:hypothetical protein
MEQLTMSNREFDRVRVIRDTIDGKLTWDEAGGQLLLSARQVGRLCAKVRQSGNKGVIHGLRGQPSNHQLPPGLLGQSLTLVKARYPDFGPTFANEKLRALHGMILSTNTLRAGMISVGLYTPRKHKPKHRAWRERRPCVGELVQLDGSDHDWFEGRGPRCALLVFIDDATSRILWAEFIAVEDTQMLLESVKKYLLLHGRPVSFYVDKDSIYKVNRQATIEEELRDAQPITQFTRAMGELGIEMIFAESPQAKGRVERGFHTHQDRLVKELRLAGISDMSSANRFLREVYVPQHNARFEVVPASAHNAHRPLLKSHKLDEILSFRTERTVFNDYTVRLQNRFFQITDQQPLRVKPKDKVKVETRLDRTIHIKCKGEELAFKELPQRPYKGYYATRKPASASVGKTAQYKPPKNHPWRIWRSPDNPQKNCGSLPPC